METIKTINAAIALAPWIETVHFEDKHAARVSTLGKSFLFYLNNDCCRSIQLAGDHKTALETATADGAINLESVRKALEL